MTFADQLWRTVLIACIAAVPSGVVSVVVGVLVRRWLNVVRGTVADASLNAANAAVSAHQSARTTEDVRDAVNQVRASLGGSPSVEARLRELEKQDRAMRDGGRRNEQLGK